MPTAKLTVTYDHSEIQIMARALGMGATQMLRDWGGRFERVYRQKMETGLSTWTSSSKPKVEVKTTWPRGEYGWMGTGWGGSLDFTLEVEASGKPYEYVDLGTRPHVIVPRVAKVLAFASGYRPKTQVSSSGVSSVGGGPYGETVFAHAVNHPGTQAMDITGGVFDMAEADAESGFELPLG